MGQRQHADDSAVLLCQGVVAAVAEGCVDNAGPGCAFFFSSRRRHTRVTCDWSSDVCSSDLGGEMASTLMSGGASATRSLVAVSEALKSVKSRSEERRVGKECRTRWSPDY